MLATIWRADVQSSQAQQRRTAFRGGQTHFGSPRWLRAERKCPHYRPVRVAGAGRALPRAAPSRGTAGVEIENRLCDASESAAGT
jgi:hypothetical protein